MPFPAARHGALATSRRRLSRPKATHNTSPPTPTLAFDHSNRRSSTPRRCCQETHHLGRPVILCASRLGGPNQSRPRELLQRTYSTTLSLDTNQALDPDEPPVGASRAFSLSVQPCRCASTYPRLRPWPHSLHIIECRNIAIVVPPNPSSTACRPVSVWSLKTTSRRPSLRHPPTHLVRTGFLQR